MGTVETISQIFVFSLVLSVWCRLSNICLKDWNSLTVFQKMEKVIPQYNIVSSNHLGELTSCRTFFPAEYLNHDIGEILFLSRDRRCCKAAPFSSDVNRAFLEEEWTVLIKRNNVNRSLFQEQESNTKRNNSDLTQTTLKEINRLTWN